MLEKLVLFEKAKRLADEDPSRLVVLFIDEINEIGEQRGSALEGGQREFNSTTGHFWSRWTNRLVMSS